MKAYQTKIEDLSYFQKCELSKRTLLKIVDGEIEDPKCNAIDRHYIREDNGPMIGKTLFDVFKHFGFSDRSAKIQSKKVVDSNGVKNDKL